MPAGSHRTARAAGPLEELEPDLGAVEANGKVAGERRPTQAQARAGHLEDRKQRSFDEDGYPVERIELDVRVVRETISKLDRQITDDGAAAVTCEVADDDRSTARQADQPAAKVVRQPDRG